MLSVRNQKTEYVVFRKYFVIRLAVSTVFGQSRIQLSPDTAMSLINTFVVNPSNYVQF
jgi:hypothetical protein